MGRSGPGDYSPSWTAPAYAVDAAGKVRDGYTPPGVHNWGRWGDDDQIGTQNLIGAAERLTGRHGRSAAARSSRWRCRSTPADRAHTRPAPLHWFLMTGSDQIAGTPYAAVDPTSSGTTTCSRCRCKGRRSGMPSPT